MVDAFGDEDQDCEADDDVIELLDEHDLDDFLDAEQPLFADTERFAEELRSTQIPCRVATRVCKTISCNDGIPRSVLTLSDHGARAELLSQLLVGVILVELASMTIDELRTVGGGVNRTNGPYFVVQNFANSPTPLFRFLSDFVMLKGSTKLFRIMLVNHRETEHEQAFLKGIFPSVADLVAGFLTENTTCHHEDFVRIIKYLMQAGPKTFEIGAGGKQFRQILDNEQSKSVIRTTKMDPEVQATTHAGLKPPNGKGTAVTLQFTHRNPIDGDEKLIQETVAHFADVLFFGNLPGGKATIQSMRDKLENMLDLDQKLDFGAQHGKCLRRSIRDALVNKDNAEFFTDKHVLEYCRLRLFWEKIHLTMGRIFYRDRFWTPKKDKALLEEARKFVRTQGKWLGRVDWDSFMANNQLGFGRTKMAYQLRLSLLWIKSPRYVGDGGWETRLGQAVEYRKTHGKDPHSRTSLGHWVVNNRCQYNDGTLSQYRRKCFENSGIAESNFDRSLDRVDDDKWNDNLQAVIKYRIQHGQDPPTNSPEYKWLCYHRSEHGCNIMLPHRRKPFEDSGVLEKMRDLSTHFNLDDTKWIDNMNRFIEYRRKHGMDMENTNWLRYNRNEYRKNTMQHHRRKQFEESGLLEPMHRPRKKTDTKWSDAKWSDGLNKLITFRRKYGRDPQQSKDRKLYDWLRQNRLMYNNNKMAPHRRKPFEDSGLLGKSHN